jgi:hypothetical protein
MWSAPAMPALSSQRELVMHALLYLLLITALSIPTPTLVLRSGHRIDVDGSVSIDQGRVIFRSGGALYSVPEAEVDVVATRAAANVKVVKPETTMRLKVSEEERKRLLKELEENHSGTPTTATLPPYVPTEPPTPREQASSDEWTWRRDAQAYEESIRRACEERDLLTTKAEALRAHIAGLLSLGHRPNEFTYDSTELAYTLEQIPRAELEVERAQRAFALFKENARKLGIPPGWLR